MFDGGHTIAGAAKAARGVSADDTVVQEALQTIKALLRDASTPRGLPLATWDKPTFDSVAAALESKFKIPKAWFYELNTYSDKVNLVAVVRFTKDQATVILANAKGAVQRG